MGGDGEDKPEIATRVEWSGVGVDLRSGDPTAAEVRKAVLTVLGETGYLTRAGELRAEFDQHDALGAIAEVVEGAGAAAPVS